MLRVLRKALVSSCSLLVLAGSALAVDWVAVDRELAGKPDQAAQDRVYQRLLMDPEVDRELGGQISEYLEAKNSAYGWTDEGIERAIRSRAFMQRSESLGKTEALQNAKAAAAAQAKEIKSNPMFQDQGEQDSSNWIGRSMERFGEALSRLLQRSSENIDPNINAPNVNLDWVIYVVWGILAAVVLVFLFFAGKHMQWRNRLRRKATAMLEEDEPERTLDEWLAQADLLASQGRHREAVRCLYLACLLRFDEHGIARFIRGETNWEHLKRIEQGGKLPDGIDFRSPTQAFDRIWYGFHVRGADDVTMFRTWYEDLTRQLTRKAA